MARKVFMSVLGTGFYSECTYVGVNTRTRTRFIQEATLNEIGAKGWRIVRIYSLQIDPRPITG